MDIAEHISALAAEGRMLAEAAEAAGPDAKVPTCPDWTVADLLRHTAGVHRWAAAIVSQALKEPGNDEEYFTTKGDPVSEYVDAHAALVAALSQAPDHLDCFAFLPAPSAKAFWARRQCHEASIHRADADAAAGTATSYSSAHASDGIDELLIAFLPRPSSRLKATEPWSICVVTTDTDAAWTVRVSDEMPHCERTRTQSDVLVEGTASDLYRFLWNRRDEVGLDISGDESKLVEWRELVTVRWS